MEKNSGRANLIKEVMLSRWQHTDTLREERKDMELALPSSGHLWPFGSAVGDDASQTAQRRASKANSVFERVYKCECLFVCTQGCGPAVTNHSRVKMYAPMIAKFHKVGKGLMFAHFAPCQCSFSVSHRVADVSPCVWLLLCRLRITEEEERSLHGHGKADRLWTCALERQDSGTKLPSYQVWFTVHALLPHKERQERAQKETAWHLVTFTHFYISTHTHTQTLEALFVHCAARSGQMMRGMRGKGWGHVRELEPGATDRLKSTQQSLSPAGILWVYLWV